MASHSRLFQSLTSVQELGNCDSGCPSVWPLFCPFSDLWCFSRMPQLKNALQRQREAMANSRKGGLWGASGEWLKILMSYFKVDLGSTAQSISMLPRKDDFAAAKAMNDYNAGYVSSDHQQLGLLCTKFKENTYKKWIRWWTYQWGIKDWNRVQRSIVCAVEIIYLLFFILFIYLYIFIYFILLFFFFQYPFNSWHQ